MTGTILPFNQNSLLPEAAAQTLILPVESKGLREIIACRYAEQMAEIKNADSTPREKIEDLQIARNLLQETLDLIGQCAKAYFRKKEVSADAACALFGALTGDMTACYWQETDAKKGWGMYQCMSLLEYRIMRDADTMREETNPEWRKIIFIRQVILLNDLRNTICDVSTNDQYIDPRHFDAYRKATEIVWPKSPLSVVVASAATKLRTTCAKAGLRPVAQHVV